MFFPENFDKIEPMRIKLKTRPMTRLETQPSSRLWKSSALALMTAFCWTMAGCGPTDADKISDAQSCLNMTSPAGAPACVAMVAGIVSQDASLIRCSGAFIQEGFGDASKIASALTNIDNDPTSTGSMAMMAVLAFQGSTDVNLNLTTAQSAQTECANSGSPGLIFLSGVALTATQAVALFPGISDPTNVTPADIQTGLTNLADNAADPATQAVVGNAVLSMYDVSCQNGSSNTAGNYCEQFQSVIDQVGSAPADIGKFLATCYITPATAGCQGF
jgi:hypothetical protein